MLRIISASLEAHLRKRYSPVHVATRVAQVDEVLGSARGHAQATHAEVDALTSALRNRLWLPPELARQWLDARQRTLALLETLLARLSAARAGYAALPLDEALPAFAPAPVAWSA
jgi:MoxR-like ATPase